MATAIVTKTAKSFFMASLLVAQFFDCRRVGLRRRTALEPGKDSRFISGRVRPCRDNSFQGRPQSRRHPEVAAKRPSKDASQEPRPSPFEARFARTSG